MPSYPTPDLPIPIPSASAHAYTTGTGIDTIPNKEDVRPVPTTVRMYVDELLIAAKLYIASM